MNYIFKKIGVVALGLTMAIGVGVSLGKNSYKQASADASGYTISSSRLTTLTNNQLVVWGTSSTNCVSSIGSNWGYLSSKRSEQLIFKVVEISSKFYLQSIDDDYYVYSSAEKKIALDENSKTAITLSNGIVYGGSSIGYYVYNSSGIRPYKTNSYTNAYLYAATASESYTITYNGNGADSGSVTATTGSGSVTLSNNANGFVRAGYKCDGWATEAEGAKAYNLGGSYSLSADVTLYAHWVEAYTVTYDANGGTGTTTDSNLYASGENATALDSSFTYSGHRFTGWNTLANGTGDPYAVGASISITGNVTLFAQWATTYTVTYNANGGTGSVTDNNTYIEGEKATVLSNSFTAPDGKIFNGWNTLANGTGTPYAVGDKITIGTANVELFAQWANKAVLSFNSNGGSGTMAAQNFAQGATTTAPASTFTAKTDCTFAGWNTLADGTGTPYVVGASITMSDSITLFAQWTPKKGTATYPFTVAEAIDKIDSGTAGTTVWYITGYVTELVTSYNNSKFEAFDLVDDPTKLDDDNVDFFRAYRVNKNSKSAPKKGDLVTVRGQIMLYNSSIYETKSDTGYLQNIDEAEVLSSISLSATSKTFTAGSTFSYDGTVTPTYLHQGTKAATSENLTYKIGNTTITPGSTVMTKATHDGATVKVRYTDSSSLYAEADLTLTVNYKATTSVSLDKSSYTLYKNDSVTLVPTVTDEYALQTVKWLSSDASVASVSDGVVTSYAKAGTATITAYSDENGNDTKDVGEKYAECAITVVIDKVLTISQSSITKYHNEGSFTLTRTAAENFIDAEFEWSSDNTDVVVVDTQSATSATFIIGDPGSATITLLALDSDLSETTATCDVTIEEEVLTLNWGNRGTQIFTVGDKFALKAGATLTKTYANTNNPGHNQALTLGTDGVKVLLNGSEINASTYTFTANDDGKTIAIRYTDSDSLVSTTSSETIKVVRSVTEGSVSNGTFNFSSMTSSSGSELTNSAFTAAMWSSADDGFTKPTMSAKSKLYGEAGSIRIGTGSASGYVTFTSTKSITRVVVNFVAWDAATLSVTNYEDDVDVSADGSADLTLSSGATSITFETNNKRLKITSITFYSSNMVDKSQSSAAIELHDFINEFMHMKDVSTDNNNDTGACKGNSGYYALAKAEFNTLSAEARALFVSHSAYALEYARLAAWANANGDKFETTEGENLNKLVEKSNVNLFVTLSNNTPTIIVILSIISVSAIGGYFFLRKKKQY